MKNYSAVKICASILLLWILAGSSDAQSDKMGELIEGQWAEGRAFDPFGSRPIQLWLPEGTLIYDITESDRAEDSQWKYRFATTYHGYPVNLKLQPKKGTWKYRQLGPEHRPAKFRLNQSVFCPGETNPIVWPTTQCLYGPARGEGWSFEFSLDPETTTPKRFDVAAIPDQKTIHELKNDNVIYRFKIYEKDMDFYEKKGVLFRLDRSHPLLDFSFLGYSYFPCNTEKTTELKQEEIQKKFVEASGEAGFGFWTWFKATLKGGVGFEDKDSQVEIVRTKIESSKSSVFQQWGLMRRRTGSSIESVPFFVEKQFECQPGAGTTEPGARISTVVVKFWNSEEDQNDTYEFNSASDWVVTDDKIFDYTQRPVFLCVNNSNEQAAVIRKILEKNAELHFNQAIFIFAQLNNGCGSTDRERCDNYVTVP